MGRRERRGGREYNECFPIRQKYTLIFIVNIISTLGIVELDPGIQLDAVYIQDGIIEQ